MTLHVSVIILALVFFYVRPDGSITDAPSNDCIGVVLNAQGKRFMIEKYEDLNESYVTAGSGEGQHFRFFIGVDMVRIRPALQIMAKHMEMMFTVT